MPRAPLLHTVSLGSLGLGFGLSLPSSFGAASAGEKGNTPQTPAVVNTARRVDAGGDPASGGGAVHASRLASYAVREVEGLLGRTRWSGCSAAASEDKLSSSTMRTRMLCNVCTVGGREERRLRPRWR